MAANTNPIFGLLPDNGWIGAVATANTTTDLTSGTIYLAYTADATNGSYLEKLVFRALGTNVATVARIWINNGSTTGTAANNTLYKEITLPATTASQVAALADQEMPMGIGLNPGHRVYITVGTTVSAGYGVTAVATKY